MAVANLANTQDLVAIQEIRDNTLILKSGRLMQILMVDGMNFSLKSEEEQNVITASYQNFLNGLDFPIQIVVHSRKINIEHYLQNLKNFESKEQSSILQNQIAEYREFITAFVKDNPIMTKTFFAVVPMSPVAIAQKETFAKFFPFIKIGKAEERKKKTLEEHESSFRRNLVQLEQRVSQVTEGLTTIGLEAVRLTTQALIELFYNFYNPETTEREDISLPEHEK